MKKNSLGGDTYSSIARCSLSISVPLGFMPCMLHESFLLLPYIPLLSSVIPTFKLNNNNVQTPTPRGLVVLPSLPIENSFPLFSILSAGMVKDSPCIYTCQRMGIVRKKSPFPLSPEPSLQTPPSLPPLKIRSHHYQRTPSLPCLPSRSFQQNILLPV